MSEPAVAVQPESYTHSLLKCGRLTLDHIQFDATQFDSTLFQKLSIEKPPQIKRAVQKRKAEFFYGRLATRFATQRFGFTGNIPINADRSPQWPSTLCGAISHCQGEAIAVALPATIYAGVGVDIEQVAKGDTLSALRRMIVNAEEKLRLQQYQGIYSEATLLTLIFSAKESFYKAAYPQVKRFFGFGALCFQSINAIRQQIRFIVTEDLSPQIKQGQPVVIDFCLPEPNLVVSALTSKSEKILNLSE